jgi:hypothetical protein
VGTKLQRIALESALAAVLFACGGDVTPTGPNNVILVSIDALRADHVGAYGYVE